jgi:uncharacterized membrane protein
MGLGTSLFLIAVGAILRFAVTTTVSGVNVQTVGVILMVVGVIGLVLSLLWARLWTDRHAPVAVEEPVAPRAVVREREYR